MESLPLGSTGLRTTPLGLGLAALGRPAYIDLGHERDLPEDRSVESMQHHAHEMLDHACALGIRYFDAARSYGLAERFLARWLAQRPEWTAELSVGSKWGYVYTADWQVDVEVHEVKDHSQANFRRQLAETRFELGGHLDLYQVHSATLETGVLDDNEVLAGLWELSEDGVVVGLSVSGPAQAETVQRALEATATGRAPFRSVQATWNLLEPTVGPSLEAAAEAGWAVIVKEAVANGRLTPRSGVAESLQRVADDHGATVDAVAIAAAGAQPFQPLVLSGASTRAQLESNVTALDLDLDDEELAQLRSLAEPPEQYWATRSELPWT